MHNFISIAILKSLPKYLILSIVIALSESKLGVAQIIVLTTLSVELKTLSKMAGEFKNICDINLYILVILKFVVELLIR